MLGQALALLSPLGPAHIGDHAPALTGQQHPAFFEHLAGRGHYNASSRLLVDSHPMRPFAGRRSPSTAGARPHRVDRRRRRGTPRHPARRAIVLARRSMKTSCDASWKEVGTRCLLFSVRDRGRASPSPQAAAQRVLRGARETIDTSPETTPPSAPRAVSPGSQASISPSPFRRGASSTPWPFAVLDCIAKRNASGRPLGPPASGDSV